MFCFLSFKTDHHPLGLSRSHWLWQSGCFQNASSCQRQKIIGAPAGAWAGRWLAMFWCATTGPSVAFRWSVGMSLPIKSNVWPKPGACENLNATLSRLNSVMFGTFARTTILNSVQRLPFSLQVCPWSAGKGPCESQTVVVVLVPRWCLMMVMLIIQPWKGVDQQQGSFLLLISVHTPTLILWLISDFIVTSTMNCAWRLLIHHGCNCRHVTTQRSVYTVGLRRVSCH